MEAIFFSLGLCMAALLGYLVGHARGVEQTEEFYEWYQDQSWVKRL